MNCLNCKILISGNAKKRFCSGKCRVAFLRSSKIVTKSLQNHIKSKIVTESENDFVPNWKRLNSPKIKTLEDAKRYVIHCLKKDGIGGVVFFGSELIRLTKTEDGESLPSPHLPSFA